MFKHFINTSISDLYSLTFGHQVRILSWYKWMQALIYPYSTLFYPLCMKADWYYWFTKNMVNLCWNHSNSVMLWYKNTLKLIFNLSSEFHITWPFLFLFGSRMENSTYIFGKGLLSARNVVFCLKTWKFWELNKSLNRVCLFFSLKLSTCALLSNIYKI